MARLYRPKIVEYRLRDGSYRTPDGKRVTKHTSGAVKSSRLLITATTILEGKLP